jgi:hypothetical protein
MTSYTVIIHRTHSLLKLTYKKGELCKIEIKSIGLNSQQYQQLGTILPPQEEDIERYQEKWNGSVSYTKDEQQTASLYTQFLEEWFGFYNRLYGFPPKFTGADGKALKQIISYLQQVSNDVEALSTWQYLLGNWQKMDAFHQKNTDLKYINSQLNKILQNAKRGNNNAKQQAYGSDFKRKILEGIFTS